MLDAYIIEDIKKREDERRRQEELERPRLRIEIEEPRGPGRDHETEISEEDEQVDEDVVRIGL